MSYMPALSNYYDQLALQQQVMSAQQGMQQPFIHRQTQQGITVKVDGPTEAMNRFLMSTPAVQLVPGFISDALFDINGRQFYTLSVEHDGRRNLETFDYTPHVEQEPVTIDGAEFVSRQEFDEYVAKVNAVLGALNGISGSVQAAATAVGEQS